MDLKTGGSLCFNALHVSTPSAQSSITVHTSDFGIFGSVMPTTQIVDGDIIYKSPSALVIVVHYRKVLICV